MTTQNDIKRWFENGVEQKAMFMFVICDTFDWEDFPSYAFSVGHAREMKGERREMAKIMEIYDLREPMQPQLDKHLHFAEIK